MALRVVITDCDLGSVAVEEEILRRELDEVEVVVAQCRTEDDVIDAASGADALLVQWAPVSKRVLDALPDLRMISRYGIGLDMVDLEAARAKGVEVRNVPDYCIEEVATHAVAGLLATWRRLSALDAQVRAGGWAAGQAMGGVKRLSESTLGLVGFGRISMQVARAFDGWGTEVIAYDPFITEAPVELVSLEELARRADLISLHCPLTDDTRGLVGREFLSRVQPTTVIANTARGALVDDVALVEALTEGRLAGAALDVFTEEPLPAESPLRQAPNLLIGPHAAWCSTSALPALQAGAAWNVVDHFRKTA